MFGEANPFGIAVDQATDTIYTANIFNGEGPGTVSVINGATCNAHNTSGCDRPPPPPPPASAPRHRGRPDDDRVYATNIEDTSVTTINGHTCNGTKTSGCDRSRTQAIVGDYPGSITSTPQPHRDTSQTAEGVSVMPLNRRLEGDIAASSDEADGRGGRGSALPNSSVTGAARSFAMAAADSCARRRSE